MNESIAFLYGLIQGISEFAPVSSSGHLALLPHLIDFKDPGVVFDLAMHLGTAMAVMIYFYKDIQKMIASCLSYLFKKNRDDHFYFTVNFLISTATTVVMILILKDFALSFGRSPKLIAINLIVFGLLMWAADHFFKTNDKLSMNLLEIKKAAYIGFAQSLAIFPGVSRSGITLTAARMFNFSRIESAKYSFLLSLPIILAGAFYKTPELLRGGANYNLTELIIGVMSSFLFGLITIHFFLKILKRFGLGFFAVYRIIIAILVLV